jgi:hypothetical protein
MGSSLLLDPHLSERAEMMSIKSEYRHLSGLNGIFIQVGLGVSEESCFAEIPWTCNNWSLTSVYLQSV